MRIGDSAEEARFRAELRGWLSDQLSDGAPRSWSSEQLRSWSKSLYQAGYAGLSWPVEHGGRGLPATYQAIYAEESARAGAPDHVNVIGLNMVGPTIIRYGTEAQQAQFLPRILSGETIFCQGFSEPDAGSDLASVRTRARADSAGYQVNGEKVWSSYAHLADYCLLLVRTDPQEAKHRGLTCLLMDMQAPGVQVRPLRELSGDTDFNQVILTDVLVGSDSVLGPVGEGWRVAMTTLAHERGTFGITLTSRLSAELDRLVQTTQALDAQSDPLIRREIAKLHVHLQGLRFTGYRALAELQRTGEPGAESSILKLGWSMANQRLTALALRVLGADAAFDGPHAFWAGYWQQQQLRSRTNSIEGGTSEILRGIVSERVLGLPRSR